jgi:hypothetical protein
MRLRLTKKQREYQIGVLDNYGLRDFEASSTLVGDLAEALVDARNKLEHVEIDLVLERQKSLLRILRERIAR